MHFSFEINNMTLSESGNFSKRERSFYPELYCVSRKLQSEKNCNKMQTMTLFIFTMTARIYVCAQAWPHEILGHYLHPSLL